MSLVELHEFELEEDDTGRLVYVLARTTLHNDEGDAFVYAADRFADGGYGDSFRGPGFMLPGKAWTYQEIEAVRTEYSAGKQKDGDDDEALPILEGDEPLPPN